MASAAHEVHTGAMREGVPRAPEGGRVPPSHPASHPTGTRFRRLAPVFVACRGCGRRLGRRSQLDRVAAARSVSVAKYVARLLHVEIVEASASRSPTSTFEVQAGGRWVSATAATRSRGCGSDMSRDASLPRGAHKRCGIAIGSYPECSRGYWWPGVSCHFL